MTDDHERDGAPIQKARGRMSEDHKPLRPLDDARNRAARIPPSLATLRIRLARMTDAELRRFADNWHATQASGGAGPPAN